MQWRFTGLLFIHAKRRLCPTAAEQPQIIAMHLALLLQPGAGSSATGTTRDSAIPTRSVDSRELLSAEDRIFSGLGGPSPSDRFARSMDP